MKFELLKNSRIKLRHLKVFVDVGASGSVTESASRMHTSQPALSRTVAELESLLKCRLFDRTTAGVALTPEGRRLQAYVLAAFDQLEDGLNAVGQDFQNQYVRCAILPSVARKLFPRAVARFKAEFPDVSIEINDSGDPAIFDALRRGELDFAVGRLSPPHRMDGLGFRHMYNEPLKFIVNCSHPLAVTDILTVANLAEFPMVLPPTGVIIRAELDRFLIAHDNAIVPNRIETLSFEFIRALVADSETIAFCPIGAVEKELESGQFVGLNFAGPPLMGSIGITSNAIRTLSVPAQRLTRLIVSEAETYSD